MTVAEKKAMNLEIQRQLAEYDKKHATEIDALILWVLHSESSRWYVTVCETARHPYPDSS